MDLKCWPFCRAVQRTILKQSEFGGHKGPCRKPTPSDKWIGNKLPKSRDGPLILIKRWCKKVIRSTWRCQQSRMSEWRFSFKHTHTHITPPRMLCLKPVAALLTSLCSFSILGWCSPPQHYWHLHPPSLLNSLPCPISWAWLETKRQTPVTEWPGQPEI